MVVIETILGNVSDPEWSRRLSAADPVAHPPLKPR